MLTRPSTRFPLLALLLAALAALLLAACGGDEEDAGPDPAGVAPGGSIVYGELIVQPEGDRREAIDASIGRLIGEADPIGSLESMLDEELSEEDAPISFSEDIKPWLGERAGFFVTDFSEQDVVGGAILPSTDNGRAQAMIDEIAGSEDGTEEVEYEGSSYVVVDDAAIGMVEDFVVLATPAGFEAVVDATAADETVAESSRIAEALDGVDEDGLFRVFADPQPLLDALLATGQIDEEALAPFEEQLAELGDAPVALSGLVEEDALSFAFSGPSATEGEEADDRVSELPVDAWLALGVPNLGETLGVAVDQFIQSFEQGFGELEGLPGVELPDLEREIESAIGLDLKRDLAWIGDVSLFLEGTSVLGVGAGVLIDTDDEAAARDAIRRLGQALEQERSLEVTETGNGLRIQGVGLPFGAEIVVEDGRVIIAGLSSSIEDVLSPSETLGDSERFQGAAEKLGGELVPGFYLDLVGLVALIESTGEVSGDPGYQAAKPTLDKLDYVIAGSAGDGEESTGRIVLGLRDGSSSSGDAATITPP